MTPNDLYLDSRDFYVSGGPEDFGGSDFPTIPSVDNPEPEYDIPSPPISTAAPATDQSPSPQPPLTPRREAFLLAMSPIVVDMKNLQPHLQSLVDRGLFAVTPFGQDTHLVRTVTGDFYLNEHSAESDVIATGPSQEFFAQANADRLCAAVERCGDMLEEIAVHLGSLAVKAEDHNS